MCEFFDPIVSAHGPCIEACSHSG